MFVERGKYNGDVLALVQIAIALLRLDDKNNIGRSRHLVAFQVENVSLRNVRSVRQVAAMKKNDKQFSFCPFAFERN